MHFPTIALTTLIASVAAVPTWKGNDWKGKDNKKYWKDVKDYPKYFTSTYEVKATPDQVVNANNTFTGGLDGAEGLYRYGINKDCDVICYDIIITGFRGEYQSPARTATHIHEGAVAKNGPPRYVMAPL